MERNPSKNHQRNKKRDSRIKEQSKENKEKDKTIGGEKLKEIYQQYLKENEIADSLQQVKPSFNK